MANKQTITVKSNEENPEPVELIAQAIIDVADAFKRINNRRLTRRAVVVLLYDKLKSQGISISAIEAILDAAPKLDSYYIKQIPKGGK